MIFKKGDKVKFLNDVGGGVVTRTDNKTVYVLNEDGFEIPVLQSQLLKTEAQEESTPFTTPVGQPTPDVSAERFEPVREPAPAPDYIDLSDADTESDAGVSVNLLLAWVMNRKKNGKLSYDVYLVNDCSYHIMYMAAMVTCGTYRGIQAGMLENDTTIHLTEISAEELKNIVGIHLESLFFKKGAFMPQEPMHYEIRIDEFYLTDPGNYTPNVYFDDDALIFNMSEEFLMAEIERTAGKAQSEFEKQKRRIDSPKIEPVVKKESSEQEEVDLHIAQLTDNLKNLTPGEMLDIQMSRFNIALEGAIRKRQKRIVFIHGVGNGRLRLEICRVLDQKYPKLRYQDASFKEYGYGATLVFL